MRMKKTGDFENWNEMESYRVSIDQAWHQADRWHNMEWYYW